MVCEGMIAETLSINGNNAELISAYVARPLGPGPFPGEQYEFHMYDGAGHGFFYYDRPMYRIEQALDGWKKVFAFLEKHLAQ